MIDDDMGDERPCKGYMRNASLGEGMWTIHLAQDRTHEWEELLDQLSDLGYASIHILCSLSVIVKVWISCVFDIILQ
jgi:hypothetical protein